MVLFFNSLIFKKKSLFNYILYGKINEKAYYK